MYFLDLRLYYSFSTIITVKIITIINKILVSRGSEMSNESATERRARTKKEIKQLIAERNAVLSKYYNLARQTDDPEIDLSTTCDQLEEFCQELVDYMAIGHFEIYSRLEDGSERRREILSLAEKIMPRINDTTQLAVAFNDIYDDVSNINEEALSQLPTHLSKLGEELATRIDLEDQFIHTLLVDGSKPKLTTVSV